MPRAGQRIKTRKPAAVKPVVRQHKPADALAHNRLVRYMEDHFEWMLVTGYSADTVRARRVALRKFIGWADERGLDDPREITKPMLESATSAGSSTTASPRVKTPVDRSPSACSTSTSRP